MNTPKYIIIHSTDVSWKVNGDQFNAVDNYHRQEGFPRSALGYYVGYHRLITGGINHQARRDGEMGAHTNQVENGRSINLQSLGICVGFDGDIEYPLPQDYDLLKAQVKAWQDMYGIPNEDVRYHRSFNTAKTCPGSLCGEEWMKNLLDNSESPGKPSDQEEKQKSILIQKISLLQRLIALYQQLTKK